MTREHRVQAGPEPQALKVFYITMRFPVASETFAAVEVRALRRHGADISVHALRPRPRKAAPLLRERGLADLTCSDNSLRANLRGLAVAAHEPWMVLPLLALIARACWRRPLQLLGSLALLPRAFDLLSMVRAERPHVVHLFWGHYPSLVGLLVNRLPHGSLVSMFLGAYDLEKHYGCTEDLAREAPIVWTHAAANLPALARIGVAPDRCVVAYRGLDLSDIRTGTADKDHGRILVAERLIPEKRTDDALRVFHGVQAAFPKARMIILGDGPERRRLERLAAGMGLADRVAFKGHVSHDAVFQQMNRAHVFLCMSQNPSERLPNAVKEAMYCRCLCVVADSVGLNELIVHGVHGLIVGKGDVEAARREICRILADPGKSDRMTAAAHDRIVEGFDVDAITRTRIETWRALLQQRAA